MGFTLMYEIEDEFQPFFPGHGRLHKVVEVIEVVRPEFAVLPGVNCGFLIEESVGPVMVGFWRVDTRDVREKSKMISFFTGREGKFWFSKSFKYKVVDPVIDLDGFEIAEGINVE